MTAIELAPVPAPLSPLAVRPWRDPVIDRVGHDPRSAYVEQFWLGILGPSATWLLRRLAAGFDEAPAGFELDLEDTARALGLSGARARRGAFDRAVERLCRFELAQADTGLRFGTGGGDGMPDGPPDQAPAGVALLVRRRVPPLARRLVRRLPEAVQEQHDRWVEQAAETPPLVRMQLRARRLGLSLVELGEDRDAVERQLLRWRFPPVLAKEATAWAWQRSRGDDLADGTGPAGGDEAA